MDELLKKLLEADILSEEMKTELQESMTAQLEEATTAAKAETEVTVRSELQEQWANEKETLVEALDLKVEEVIEEEISELKTSIDAFRDLEAEYADKLVEAKSEMRDELKSDLRGLVESIDSFLEMRLTTEISELKEELNHAQKNNLGERIMETFGPELSKFVDNVDYATQLSEMKEELDDAKAELKQSDKEKKKAKRDAKMESLLKSLSGKTRNVMEAVLKSVPTEKLDEGYTTYLPRIMKDSDDNFSEKEVEVLAESKKTDRKKKKKAKKADDMKDAEAMDGDKEGIDDKEEKSKLSENTEMAAWKRLAGITE